MTVMVYTPDGEAHYFYEPQEVLIEEAKGIRFEAHNDGFTQVYKYKKEEKSNND